MTKDIDTYCIGRDSDVIVDVSQYVALGKFWPKRKHELCKYFTGDFIAREKFGCCISNTASNSWLSIHVPSGKRIKVQILFRHPDEANSETIRRGNDEATVVPAKIHENQYEPTLREMEPI